MGICENEDGIYGYEPVNIQLAKPRIVPEDSNVNVFIFGYAIKRARLIGCLLDSDV